MPEPLIDGPRLAPRSGRPARQLVVFLHGYGADGGDLIEIGRQWAPALPDAAFVSPHAPEPCDMAPGGRQWFALAERSAAEIGGGVARAAPVLDAFLDAELARHGLPAAALALVGFSQGTMVALGAGLARRERIAGIVGFSGMLAGAAPAPVSADRALPILLVHGEADQVIPAEATRIAADMLGAAGHAVEWHLRPNLPHGIDAEGMIMAAEFLRRVLPG